MYLTTKDYISIIDADDLDVLSKGNTKQRQSAEGIAQETISGYLRSRYDVDAVFTETDEDRNSVIIMLMVNIAVYHMSGKIAGRVITDDVRQRYDDAMKMLKDIQRGDFAIELPLIDADDSGMPMRFGSLTKATNDW